MILLTAPATEPVTTTEAKRAARISDITAFDDDMAGWIKAAREQAEQISGRRFIAQTWRTELRDWPPEDHRFLIADATAVAIAYWNGSAWASMSTNDIAYCADSGATLIAPVSGTWPTLGERVLAARVRVDITAGAATAADVPESVKLYIKALVAHWVDNPGAAPQGQRGEVDPLFARLLDPVRVY